MQATSVLRGVLGMIADDARMTNVVHDRCPMDSSVGSCAHVLIRAMPAALSSMNNRPPASGACFL
jgi:hypothetical protein